MQSFRQYHKFRKAIEAQLERDKAKARSLATQPRKGTEPKHDSELSRTLEAQREQEQGQDHRDLEKGEAFTPVVGWDQNKETYRTDVGDTDNMIADPSFVREQISHSDAQLQHPTEDVEEPLSGREEAEEPRDAALEEKDSSSDSDTDDDWQQVPDSLEHRPSNLSRITTQRSNRSAVDLSKMGTHLGAVLTGINIRKRSTKEGGDGSVFIVGYEGENDPLNPHNWTMSLRIFITIMVASIGFVVGVASSIDSSATADAAAEFGVSEVAEVCATGLYLIGFGAGALFAGPFSETLGRNPVYIVTMFLFMIFVMASALAPNLGAQLVFRFLAGFFGSTPLTCAGGSLSDIWNPRERTTAFPVFANAAFLGPILGPVIGGFIAESNSVSWRWTEWTTLLMAAVVLTLVVLFLPETFPPILLKWKAKHLRAITGDDRYRAEVEIRMDPFTTRLARALYRPFLLTITEPIIVLVALYLTVIYIILFTFLDGYDYIFGEIHGVSPGVQGLCFLGIAVGLFLASPFVFLIRSMAAKRLQKANEQGRNHLPPEFRLWFAMIGAPAIPISMFWMGWTSDPNISIWSPIAASVVFGFGILCVFISSYQYVIDSYEIYAASALASVTVIRYVAAGGMTIVGIPFYTNVGVHYTCTILGCIAAACTPVPYLFYIYGPRIRAKSKYAPTA